MAAALERRAMRKAQVVIAVCPALADIAKANRAREVHLLPDISLLNNSGTDNVLGDVELPDTCFMYVGNLEPYQGVELLVQAFHLALQRTDGICLLVIGGNDDDIHPFNEMVLDMGIQDHVMFVGPRPVSQLAGMLARADVVVSPRISGINTPMKIYSYLDSGKPLLATRLPTHTQIITDKVACLADPTPEAMAKAILGLAHDEEWRQQLGSMGREFAQRFHSFPAFKKRVAKIYGYLEQEIDVRR